MDSLDCLKGLFELHQNLLKISERPPRFDCVLSHDDKGLVIFNPAVGGWSRGDEG